MRTNFRTLSMFSSLFLAGALVLNGCGGSSGAPHHETGIGDAMKASDVTAPATTSPKTGPKVPDAAPATPKSTDTPTPPVDR